MKRLVNRSATSLVDTLLGLLIVAAAITLYTSTNQLMSQQRQKVYQQLLERRNDYELAIQQKYG